MNKPYISREAAAIESFMKDPDYAAEHLNAVLEDGSQEELMLAPRRMASAFAMRKVAESSKLNPKTLARTLSPPGNPNCGSFRLFSARWVWARTQPSARRSDALF